MKTTTLKGSCRPLTHTSYPQPLPQHGQQQPDRPLIAGIGAAEGSDHYRTSYARLAEREPTSRDMLTLKKQQEAFKLDAGMQAYGRGAMASSRGGALVATGGGYGGSYGPAAAAAQHMRENMAPNSGVARGTSLIAGLGSSLAHAVPEFERGSVQGAARPKVTLPRPPGQTCLPPPPRHVNPSLPLASFPCRCWCWKTTRGGEASSDGLLIWCAIYWLVSLSFTTAPTKRDHTRHTLYNAEFLSTYG